jgi:OOP family OmpA-OmpF porin
MKPSTRWTILVLVVIAIAIIWLLWPKAEQPPAKPVVAQPAPSKPEPKPEPAPVVTPKPEAPVTVTIYFDFNQSAVRPGESSKLDDFAARIKGRSFDRIEEVGHADRIGANDYNMGLSKRRADAVQAYLAGKGVDTARVRAEAKGEGEPVTGDACKDLGPENRKNRKLIECLQRDRRVEVSLVAGR